MSPKMKPSVVGAFFESTQDALVLMNALSNKTIQTTTSRLKKENKIENGHVYVFDPDESGIKRWTDPLIWTPSKVQTL